MGSSDQRSAGHTSNSCNESTSGSESEVVWCNGVVTPERSAHSGDEHKIRSKDFPHTPSDVSVPRLKSSRKIRPLSLLTCSLIGVIAGFAWGRRDSRGNVQQEMLIQSKLDHFADSSDLDCPGLQLSPSAAASNNLLNDEKLKTEFSMHSSLPSEDEKLLIVVTPTYVRPFQAMYLSRLANTLALVRHPLLWLVVEIYPQSLETARLLRHTGLLYRHIVSKKNMTDIKDRGVHQRNAALEHIERHRLDGIVYFADDDNVYSPKLFEELRKIRRFGTWPVGMMQDGKSRAIIEGPVCEGQKVVGWHTNEKSKLLRRFHVDMCGFGFNSTILWDPFRWRRPTNSSIRQRDDVKEGFQETTFIEQLVPDESKMEGLANGCSEVLVWHLHLEGHRHGTFPHFTKKHNLTVTLPLRQGEM